MGWFSSKKTNVADQISNIFLNQFPTWAVHHATKLAHELKTSDDGTEKLWVDLLHNNQSAEKILIDCLTGAHATYLDFGLPQELLLFVGDEKKIASALLKWSETSQQFFIVASTFHKRILENGERLDFSASLRRMFALDGRLEPLAVHICTLTTKEIENALKKNLGPPFVAGLYRVISKLQREQHDWISNEVIEKAKRQN